MTTRLGVMCLFLLAVAAVVSGCAIGSTTVLKAAEAKPASFSTVEMPNLEGGGNVPEEMKRSIPAKVMRPWPSRSCSRRSYRRLVTRRVCSF